MTAFTIAPLTPNFGAAIGGIDLSSTLTEDTMRDLEQALLQWKVLFFRDQDIDIEDQKRLGSWFGELEVHPTAKKGSPNTEVIRIEEDDEHRAQLPSGTTAALSTMRWLTSTRSVVWLSALPSAATGLSSAAKRLAGSASGPSPHRPRTPSDPSFTTGCRYRPKSDRLLGET